MPAPRKRPRPRYHHQVYVVELHDRVWNEPRLRAVNPDYQLGKPFVDVGMTGFLGVYYILAAKPGLRAFLAWTVATRSSVIMVFAVPVATGLGPAVLLLFGAVDLAGAFWTWAALRHDAAGHTTDSGTYMKMVAALLAAMSAKLSKSRRSMGFGRLEEVKMQPQVQTAKFCAEPPFAL